jgi:predicted  nucleic acid-binding Zn ribbon protein
MNLKSEKSILCIFEEEHENVIDVVVFIPLKTAKTIIKARMEQDQDNEEQKGDAEEEGKEEEKAGEKEVSAASSALSKKGEELKKARERLAKLKGNVGTKTKKDEEDKQTEENEEDIVVKDEFVASGSRDKRIKIWNAKRGI